MFKSKKCVDLHRGSVSHEREEHVFKSCIKEAHSWLVKEVGSHMMRMSSIILL